jgi:ferredoxin
MDTVIYYFSGTGNSLWAANQLCNEIDNCSLMPLASAVRNNDYKLNAKKAGFVFPMHFSGLPEIMHDFLRNADFSNVEYVFVCYTLSGGPASVHGFLSKHLKKKNKRVNALMKLKMPGNYIPMYDIISQEKQKQLFDTALEKISGFAGIVNQGRSKIQSDTFLLKYIFSAVHNSWIKNVHNKDENFTVDENCTCCGMCVKVCPTDNVKITESKPQFLHNCQQCFACVNFCPEKSINLGAKTQKRTRYHHPEIKASDIENQKKYVEK